jgi:hypothetical protein
MSPQYFNPWSEVQHSQNRLPHWQQLGATYFVTWRLADSLPKALLATHFQERDSGTNSIRSLGLWPPKPTTIADSQLG